MDEKNEKFSVVFSPEKKRSFWHINREMLPYKLHFFLFIGGSGAIFPFHSAFGITALGLTASNIAASFSAVQVAIFLLKPGIGYIADYFNRLKAVIVGLAVIQVLFSLLMVIIPNNGMPGLHTIHLANNSENNTYCHLCFNSDTLKLHLPNTYLGEENFREIASCFNNNVTEDILINCPFEHNESATYNNDSFQIRQTTCNLSRTNRVLSETNVTLEDVNANGDFIVILYIKTSQLFSICLLPKEGMLYDMNFTSGYLRQYCHSVLNESIREFQHLIEKSDFITTNCNDFRKNISSHQEDEHNIGVANFKTYQYWAFAICLVITCTCGSAEFTMSDTACYESIKGADYGQQRIWGAISWGLMAPFAGYLNDYTEGYIASWCVYAVFITLQIWNLSRMNLLKPDSSENMLKDIKSIFSSMEFLLFEAGVLLNGMFTGVIWYYLTWFILYIGGNKLIVGLVHTIQCFFGEIPVMYFSGWLIKKLGHFHLISLALICHGIRFLFYSYLYNAWWILPIECLHGFSFGSFYAAMTSYGKLNSKPGTEATTQSILCTTFEALGCGFGCVIAGVCMECFGGHTTFFYASFLCVIATVINILSTFLIRFRKGSQDVTKSVANTERY